MADNPDKKEKGQDNLEHSNVDNNSKEFSRKRNRNLRKILIVFIIIGLLAVLISLIWDYKYNFEHVKHYTSFVYTKIVQVFDEKKELDIQNEHLAFDFSNAILWSGVCDISNLQTTDDKVLDADNKVAAGAGGNVKNNNNKNKNDTDSDIFAPLLQYDFVILKNFDADTYNTIVKKFSSSSEVTETSIKIDSANAEVTPSITTSSSIISSPTASKVPTVTDTVTSATSQGLDRDKKVKIAYFVDDVIKLNVLNDSNANPIIPIINLDVFNQLFKQSTSSTTQTNNKDGKDESQTLSGADLLNYPQPYGLYLDVDSSDKAIENSFLVELENKENFVILVVIGAPNNIKDFFDNHDLKDVKYQVLVIDRLECPDLKICLRSPGFIKGIKDLKEKLVASGAKFSIDMQAGKNCNAQYFTDIPEIIPKIEVNFLPVVNWQIKVPNDLYKQTAFSTELYELDKDSNAKNSLDKTGKISSSITARWLLPLKKPKYTKKNYFADLKVWMSFKNIELKDYYHFNLEVKYDYIKDYDKSVSCKPKTKNLDFIAWIPSWGNARALQDLATNKNWDTLSPVWFFPNKDGSLFKTSTFNDQNIRSIARDNHMLLIPTITQFDPDLLHNILKDKKSVDKHVDEIVNYVTQYNFDGIDIDYESTYEDDKQMFFYFLTQLSNKLHDKNKKLVYTVLPKWTDLDVYSFLPQTHRVQDWKKIGELCDEVRIMAYDYTSGSSLVPGPLSPYLWNKYILDYAVTKIDRDKIVLALPLYSHSWPDPGKDVAGTDNTQATFAKSNNAISIQYEDVLNLSNTTSIKDFKMQHDLWNKEEVYTYISGKGIKKKMYILGPSDIDARKLLAKCYGIKGIAYWRIGGSNKQVK